MYHYICTIFSKSRFPLNFCTKSHKVCWRSFRVMTDDSHSPPLSSPLPLLQGRTTLTFDSHPPPSLSASEAHDSTPNSPLGVYSHLQLYNNVFYNEIHDFH